MKRSEIEGSIKISPVAKLMIEWLSRQPPRAHSSKEIGVALGLLASHIAEASVAPRIHGFLLKKDKERDLPLAELLLSPAVRAAYSGKETRKEAA